MIFVKSTTHSIHSFCQIIFTFSNFLSTIYTPKITDNCYNFNIACYPTTSCSEVLLQMCDWGEGNYKWEGLLESESLLVPPHLWRMNAGLEAVNLFSSAWIVTSGIQQCLLGLPLDVSVHDLTLKSSLPADKRHLTRSSGNAFGLQEL